MDWAKPSKDRDLDSDSSNKARASLTTRACSTGSIPTHMTELLVDEKNDHHANATPDSVAYQWASRLNPDHGGKEKDHGFQKI